MSEMNGILAERGANYGDYSAQAELSQKLKELVITAIVSRGVKLEPYMAESLELICMKLSRIGMGDPFHEDSWRDIAGYATLSADRVAAHLMNKSLDNLMGAGVVGPGDVTDALLGTEGGISVHTHHPDAQKQTEKAGESSAAYPWPVGDAEE